MVVIRLARHGSIHKPFYHVTVADQRARRDGAFIERVGFYNPIAKGKAERLRIDLSRVDYWLEKGAQTSETVSRLVKEARRADQIGATQPADQSEEVAESAAEEPSAMVEATGEEAAAETKSEEDAGIEAAVAEIPAKAESSDDTETEDAASTESAEEEAPAAEASEATTETESDADASEDEKPAT